MAAPSTSDFVLDPFSSTAYARFMNRTATTLAHLEALATRGVGADHLAMEVTTAILTWHREAASDAQRLRQALAALSLSHDSDRDSAMRRGMVAEGRRQEGIAAALLQAAQAQLSDLRRS